MQINLKTKITGALLLFIFFGISAFEPTKVSREFRNLQVLPKDISEKALQKIMEEECGKGLGVSCNYCHTKDKNSSDLDFASDAKPEKEIARSMMRMTMEINKKYFGLENPAIGDTLMSITCKTCHQGDPYPGKKK
ncbi:MAG: c-type cytochrome [Ferruginibacter sp.]